jgi:hypothetical protein
VDPFVGNIAGGNAVSKPLVGAFVNDDEVKLQTDADTVNRVR